MRMGGGLGLQTRLFALQAERRRWREGCLRTGAVRAALAFSARTSARSGKHAA